MSIEDGQDSLAVTYKRRTWRVEFFTNYGTEYGAVIHRERLTLLPDGSVLARELLPSITRTVPQVAGELDAMQMLGLVRAIADRWEREDLLACPKNEEIL